MISRRRRMSLDVGRLRSGQKGAWIETATDGTVDAADDRQIPGLLSETARRGHATGYVPLNSW